MKITSGRHLLLFAAVSIAIILAGCSSAPETPDNITETRNRAAEYSDFGNRYLDRGQYDQALKFFNLALDDNIAIDNEEGIVLSRNSIGETYLMTGRLDQAETFFDAAMDLSLRIARKDLELRTLNNLGKLALNRGDNDIALTVFADARKIIATEKNAPREVIADIYHSTGALYKILGEYDKARENLEESLRRNKDLNRQEEMASTYYMLSSVYSKLEDYTQAESFMQNALELDKKIENSHGIADDYFGLGLITRKAGKSDEAYTSFRTALEKYIILNKLEDTLQTLRILQELAMELGRDEDYAGYARTIDLLTTSK